MSTTSVTGDFVLAMGPGAQRWLSDLDGFGLDAGSPDSPVVVATRGAIQCGQCRDACPVDAIKQQKDGSFRVEAAECTGCQACVDACPEGVTRFVPEKNVAFVCLNCGECVKYCPREALVDEDGEVKRV
jgi:ferredoxin